MLVSKHSRMNRGYVLLRAGVMLVALLGVAALAFFTRQQWLPLLQPEQPPATAAEDPHAHASDDRILLSPQARANLELVVKPVSRQEYWRTIQVPAIVVERHGKTDRGVVAPLAGVITEIHAVVGDSVLPGAKLFTLKANSDSLQSSQTDLYKTVLETRLTQEQKKKLEALGQLAPQLQLQELSFQLERLEAARKAYRADLALRGLTSTQIEQVEQGNYIRDFVVYAPKADGEGTLYEVEKLNVQLGEQVQTGQAIAFLANHQVLYIEGRGFREDAALLERAAAEGWPLKAYFPEELAANWPPLEQQLVIHHMANTIDPVSQTFPIFIPVQNQYRQYSREGKTYRIWRFRPGQRVQLGIPVQKFESNYVLPLEAVARQGPEAFVFRQNGDYFERKPVSVLYEDSLNAVLSQDSLIPGSYIAMNGAEAINRALRAQASGGGGGHGHHHGHDH